MGRHDLGIIFILDSEIIEENFYKSVFRHFQTDLEEFSQTKVSKYADSPPIEAIARESPMFEQ